MSAKQTPESFWARVNIGTKDECWEWVGSTNNTGYGTVSWHGKVYTAHRIAAFLVGMVDGAMAPKLKSDKSHVLHRCDNRRCCNPNHFFLGSYSDNQLDAYKKRRRTQPKGSRHVNAKLNDSQVIEIKQKYYNGYTQQDLADMYKVSQVAISQILRGKTYICN